MTGFVDRDLAIGALRRALPYIRLFRGKTFVVKVGGALCGDAGALQELAEQVSVLRELGIRVVVVHGGGPQTTALGAQLGLAAEFVAGRRVTSAATLAVAVMSINGTVSTAILGAARAAGLPAVGLAGVDAGLLWAQRRPSRTVTVDGVAREVDYGLVGDIVAVDATVLETLLGGGYVPVVSPLAADGQGQVLNVNADTVAARVAQELGADKLIFLTDTPGLMEDPQDARTLVSYTDVRGLATLQERGVVGGGMLPKVQAAIQAIGHGVKRVHMVGYRAPSSLLVEVFTNEGAGTLIVRDTAELLPAEQGAGGVAGA